MGSAFQGHAGGGHRIVMVDAVVRGPVGSVFPGGAQGDEDLVAVHLEAQVREGVQAAQEGFQPGWRKPGSRRATP